MGLWTSTFEALMVILFSLNIILLARKKNWQYICELIAGTIFGVLMEFATVVGFEHYTYNTDFLLQVGVVPDNIPIAIGLAWGMIISGTIEISNRFSLPRVGKAFFDAILGLSIDIAMDVVAIRLDGGFWNWADIGKNGQVNLQGFLGVAWGNYYAWFIVIFIFSMLIRIERERIKETEIKKLILFIFISPLIGAILLLLGLIIPQGIYEIIGLLMGDSVFDILWMSIACVVGSLGTGMGYLIYAFGNQKARRLECHSKNWFPFVLITSIHIYFLIAIFACGIYQEIGFFVPISLAIFGFTLYIDIYSQKTA